MKCMKLCVLNTKTGETDSFKSLLQNRMKDIRNLLDIPNPVVGIDLDGTIDENPLFFQIFTHSWPGKIIIVTMRDDREKAEADLKANYIRYDEVVLVDKPEQKAFVIRLHSISVYFDDQDEMLVGIDPEVLVLKVRNGGNFDYEDKKWFYSNETGKNIL